jgi:antitoxin (DNA-binding transcriptional repressor) of toxin-antitoxin stability system
MIRSGEGEMKKVDINEARTNLFLLVDKAVHGEPFLIMRGGRSLVKVEAVPVAASVPSSRLGFMAGQFSIPEEFDAMDADIEKLFHGEK